ncbi:hypothetical protein G6F46_014671 [Rhizopus delemar]|nr:hypothetical protein G6F46_014671 [Rhizopus delemar]
MQVGAEDAGLFVGLEHDGTGAITEQHAGGAVVPVDHAGQRFGTDHQHVLAVAGTDELVGHAQLEHKARTGRVDVKGRAPCNTELGLDQARGGGENEVRRGRADHDHVELRSPRARVGSPSAALCR